MSQLPALVSGSRQPAANPLAGQTPPKTGAGTSGLAASPLMQRTAQDVVALSKNGLDLSAKGLAQRTDALGNATVDAAQDFLGNMTRQLFGDGASVAFDSVDLQAGSSFSSGSASVPGAGGGSRAAAFSLDENAHFIGKGKITTADGQTFEFEVEVQYQSSISAAAFAQGDAQQAQPSDDAALPAKELPDTHFAGNLNDLFKLLGQQLQSSIFDSNANSDADGASASGKDGDQAGSLSLRLLKLVQPDATLEAVDAGKQAAQATPEALARARALAEAYGTDTSSGTGGTGANV